MYQYKFLLLHVLFLGLFINAKTQETKNVEIKINRHTRKILKDFVYLRGDRHTDIFFGTFKAREVDTALLLINNRIHETIQPGGYYISKYEVTNNSYRKFIEWVKDSIKRTMLIKKGYEEFALANGKINYANPIPDTQPINSALKELYYYDESGFGKIVYFKKELLNVSINGQKINIYPDTACFARIAGSYGENLQKLYFWHPAYDNYPVAGISYHQALAYCRYLNNTLARSVARKLKLPAIPVFRLPTEEEWMYAASSSEKIKKKQKMNTEEVAYYPFQSKGIELFDYQFEKKEAFMPACNYGTVKDQNGLRCKSWVGDKTFFTAPVESYEANYNGLYDMAGNIAEWTITSPSNLKFVLLSSDEQNDTLRITGGEDFHALLQKIKKYNYLKNPERISKAILNDLAVLKDTSHLRVIKGGSWNDPPVYLLIGAREVRKTDYADARIGFRVVMETEIRVNNTIFILKD